MFAYGDGKTAALRLSSPGALPAKTGRAPGESGFTVTVFLPVQLSGLTLSHRSSGTRPVTVHSFPHLQQLPDENPCARRYLRSRLESAL